MLIKDVKVVNFDNTIENADIEINGNKIKSIKPKKGQGKHIVIPGFIDMHIHGFMGHDAMDGKEAIEYMSQNLVSLGTTAFLPTLMTEKTLNDAVAKASLAKTINSRILGFHLEGPFLSVAKKGAHNEAYIEKATQEKLENLVTLSKNRIRKMTIAPENFDQKLLKILFDHQIVASLGHSNASAEEAETFFAQGVASVTHLWNGMSGVANRNAGIVEQTLIEKGVSAEIIGDLIHVDEKALKLTIEAKGAETVTLVTDSIRPAGLPNGEYVSGGLPVVKKGGAITLKNSSTLAGSGATMHDNFKNVVNLGFDLEAAVAMSSYNAATLLGEDLLGQVKVDCLADLVILNLDLSIKQVIIDGKELK